ncbi:MAG: DUF4388 domain-containing protein, partial [Verrucomicrobia bacterium]|nr:DUF4388 domain-containing protein [Verrucomicrobiota bacterium]
GVDSFWQKPITQREIKLFLEGVESVLRWDEQDGFRGVQHKSLVDIVQLECLSQSSSVLKITNGPLEGRIWLQNGHVIDAAIGDLVGEEAFKKILNWKSGNFESLPADATHARAIFSDYQALLLDAAQTVDESKAGASPEAAAGELPEGASARPGPLQESAKVKGVDFILVGAKNAAAPVESWRVENPEPLAKWTREVLEAFQELGEHFGVGSFKAVEGRGTRRNVSLVKVGEKQLCIGLQPSLSARACRETVNTVLSKWIS